MLTGRAAPSCSNELVAREKNLPEQQGNDYAIWAKFPVLG